ncbi:MAG: phosphodiester glycosidase family protein [Candidatus Gastranaerophilales bacterium]|nr:phosphodiester glycosidase family protein [Candidatus Gastranaerophilales bacterium]
MASEVDVKVFNVSVPVQKTSLKEKVKSNFKSQNVKKEPDITVSETDGLYTIKLDTKLLKGEFKPYVVTNLKTNEEVFEETGARLVINAGFFDPKNHQTVSYVTIDGQQILDPHNNKSLVENKHLQPYMDKILNRSELRVLKSNTTGELKYDIALHNDKAPDGYMILHAVQGGPGLVPELRLAEEFFVLTDKDGTIISQSASSLAKYARTFVGIKDNNLYFIIATREHPISLPDAAVILKEAGFEKGMAFDGGGSVSVDFRDTNLHIISDKDQTARKLKSFFIVTNARQANPHAYKLINRNSAN